MQLPREQIQVCSGFCNAPVHSVEGLHETEHSACKNKNEVISGFDSFRENLKKISKEDTKLKGTTIHKYQFLWVLLGV